MNKEVSQKNWILQLGEKKRHLTMISVPVMKKIGQETRQVAKFRCDCGNETERKCSDVAAGRMTCCGWKCPIAHNFAKDGHKKCSQCREMKSLKEFTEHIISKDGYSSRCNECQNDFDIKRTFGSIGLKEYNEMLQAQKGACAICSGGICMTFKGKIRKRFDIDHCHKTGKIRGLLCSKCNTAIGLLNDNPDILRRAIEYLLV